MSESRRGVKREARSVRHGTTLQRLRPSIARVTLAGLLALGVAAVLSGQDQPASQVEAIAEQLRFGIDSQVMESLADIRQNRREELVPAVAELLQTRRGTAVRTAALETLRALESPEAAEFVRANLREDADLPDSLWLEIMRSVRDLDIELSPTEAQVILDEVRRDRGQPSQLAVEALAQAAIRSRRVERRIDPDRELLDLLEDGSTSEALRSSVILALGQLESQQAVDALIGILEDDAQPNSLRYFAADSLGRIGDQAAVPALTASLDSEIALLRAYSVSALARFGADEAAIARLLEALRDDFWRVRVLALEAVAELGIGDAAPAVAFMVRSDPELRVRTEAAETLAALGGGDSWTQLEQTFADPRAPRELRLTALAQLIAGREAESAQTILEASLQEEQQPNSQLLPAIASQLAPTGNPVYEPLWSRLMLSTEVSLVLIAIRAVGQAGLDEYQAQLEDWVTRRNSSPVIVRTASDALEALGLPVPERPE